MRREKSGYFFTVILTAVSLCPLINIVEWSLKPLKNAIACISLSLFHFAVELCNRKLRIVIIETKGQHLNLCFIGIFNFKHNWLHTNEIFFYRLLSVFFIQLANFLPLVLVFVVFLSGTDGFLCVMKLLIYACHIA